MRISDWSSDVCSSDLLPGITGQAQQQRRVKEAETAWDRGEEAFQEWFSAMQPQDRAWFVQTGRYATITGRADLPGVQRITTDAPPAVEKKPEPKPGDTPEGWTKQYESDRSEEHTSELQSLMRSSYAVFCLKKKKQTPKKHRQTTSVRNTRRPTMQIPSISSPVSSIYQHNQILHTPIIPKLPAEHLT